jgi:hypothetical protein
MVDRTCRVGTYLGNCLDIMSVLPESFVDSIITDPPYGLEFMGREWDRGVPGVPFWQAALRVAKPGAILMAFGGSRTFHRLATAIEDAGWELRDCMSWMYGTGMPKGQDISKALDKRAGAKREVVGTKAGLPGYREGPTGDNAVYGAGLANGSAKCEITAPATDLAIQWQGWNTTLKPAWEPIIVAMKPLDGTFAENAEKWGVAGFNIDECRIPLNGEIVHTPQSDPAKRLGVVGADFGFSRGSTETMHAAQRASIERTNSLGRWPANVLLDDEAAASLDAQTGVLKSGTGAKKKKSAAGYQGNALGKESRPEGTPNVEYGDAGGASRFFWCAKAAKSERGEGNDHTTVKPIKLMEYLCRLTKTPTGGIVLDPFMGSGTTGIAAQNVGRDFIGIELDPHYFEIARGRLENAVAA